MSRRGLVLRLLLFVLAVCVAQTPAFGARKAARHERETVSSRGFSYRIVPAPAFVSPKAAAPVLDHSGAEGDEVLNLVDHQVSLLKAEPEDYHRYQTQPLSASALQDVAQVYITFNPAYQKLLLHYIRVWREGKAIDLTHSVKLDLMRRETDLDKNLYEGNVTAVGVLPDIRVNDVIEVAYTVVGRNPIFGERFAALYSLDAPKQIVHYHFSLIARQDRAIRFQAPPGVAVKRTSSKGIAHYTVDEDNVKPVEFDQDAPNWYQPYRILQVSEYRDWQQVAAWANGLFRVDAPLSPEIQAQLQRWNDAHLPQDQLAAAVLRWVQGEVRYFGIELGVNSHLPAAPNVTVARKFGDCKDKSLLLATLLRVLGIDAEPTLASLSFRRYVQNMLPSPALFDHAIVRAKIAGKTYWLDPTLPTQYGKLDTLSAFDYGQVLPLDGGKGQLQTAGYPPGFENIVQEVDHVAIGSFGKPVEISARMTANFNIAARLRYAHDTLSSDEFQKRIRGVALHYYPKAKPVGDVGFVDDRVNNRVTLTWKLSVDDYVKYQPGRVTGLVLPGELLGWATIPKTAQRSSPYDLPEHSKVMQTVEIDFPSNPSIKNSGAKNRKPGEFWTLTSSREIHPGNIKFVWTLKANKDSVPADKISDYLAETRDVREKTIGAFVLPVGTLSDSDKSGLMQTFRQFQNTYGRTSSGRVRAEIRGAYTLVQATRDIESGKLAGKPLAEAYRARSVAYDDRGDVKHALLDIRKAEQILPDHFDYVVSEAETLNADGQFQAAERVYEKAIKLADSSGSDDASALKGYGVALHFLGQDARAKSVFDEAVRKDSGKDPMYDAIWRYIVAGHDADAAAGLQSVMANLQDQSWPYPVGEMLLGKITPDQLIKAASSSDKGIQEDQYCEAYFYLGQKYLLQNDKADAREDFQKSVDQGVMPYIEYSLSLHELGRKKTPKD